MESDMDYYGGSSNQKDAGEKSWVSIEVHCKLILYELWKRINAIKWYQIFGFNPTNNNDKEQLKNCVQTDEENVLYCKVSLGTKCND